MKKTIFILSAIVLVGLAFDGCKKGEGDPFLSLKTRDGRITAKWKLTKIVGTDISTNVVGTITYVTTDAISFDGTTYSDIATTTASSGPAPSAVTTGGTGTYEMTIDKHGKVTWSTTYTKTAPTTAPADVRTGEGHWQWLSSDKRKDNLLIDGSGTLFSGGLDDVYELKGKELVLKYTYKTVNGGQTTSYDDTYTFTKQ